MMEVILPWPSKDLNPNARNHWSKLAKAKKAYRADCFYISRHEGASLGRFKLQEGQKLSVHLTFYLPDRRNRDEDNLLACMKSGLDGLADALGIDDSRFRTTFDVAPTIGGMVKVRISEGPKA